MRFLRPALLALLIASAAPAMAQELTWPRYEALEQQQQALEQRDFDRVERDRVIAQQRTIMSPTVTEADRGIRNLEFDRKRDELTLKAEQDRALVARERTVADIDMQSRRISPASILVVSQPELYGLPQAPIGKYYARLNGRFVVVDGTSELVEKVLPVEATDPSADVPLGARPMPLQPLPEAGRIAAKLPPAPSGQYYAAVRDRVVLVDRASGEIVETVKVSAPG
jgi:Ni/Co efflux regulator RcnB